jgi:hypothetical protein
VVEAASGKFLTTVCFLRALPWPVFSRAAHQSLRDAVAAESERERKVRAVPPWSDDCGWGAQDSSDYAGIHFKRSVATSVSALEAGAVLRDKRLSLADFWQLIEEGDGSIDPADGVEWTGGERGRERVLRSRTSDVRSYVRLLAREVPGLDWPLAAQYATFVERAHMPGVEFTEREYRTFVGVLLDVIRRIDGGGPESNGP